METHVRRLPLQPCRTCGHDFRPARVVQKYCHPRCFYLTLRSSQKGAVMAAATKRLHELTKARSRAKIAAEFGALSDREVALIKMALSRGYQRGYHRARRENQRDTAA